MTRIHIIAGEASGDVLGARLVAALRARQPDLEISGIGGPRMAEQGVPSLFDYRELALMGLLEVLPKVFRLKRLIGEAVADVAARRPDVLVTIDSPGFTLRVAEQVKPLGIPVVHYVAPQVWAWRPGRVVKLKRKVDRILCLLPFEPVFFDLAGLSAIRCWKAEPTMAMRRASRRGTGWPPASAPSSSCPAAGAWRRRACCPCSARRCG
jgi:lipid-A-disaccharide synthase